MLRNIIITFIATLLYSIFRYNIFGNVPFTDIPTVIVNKAISFSMMIILLLASLNLFYNKSDDYSGYLKTFKMFTIIHVLISISLLSQNYYQKLFTNERLTLFGNISTLAGVLSFTYMLNKRKEVVNLVVYSLIAIHLFCIGFEGWFNIEKWNGMMPPITLICFLILIVIVVLTVLNKNFQDNESKNTSEKQSFLKFKEEL